MFLKVVSRLHLFDQKYSKISNIEKLSVMCHVCHVCHVFLLCPYLVSFLSSSSVISIYSVQLCFSHYL